MSSERSPAMTSSSSWPPSFKVGERRRAAALEAEATSTSVAVAEDAEAERARPPSNASGARDGARGPRRGRSPEGEACRLRAQREQTRRSPSDGDHEGESH